jgi:ferredoxin
MTQRRVEFPGTGFCPLEVPHCAPLALHLTVHNSPVLFGCRSGLCGTCLVEVEPIGKETLAPPDALEAETLGLHAPENSKARLACQLRVSADLRIVRIPPA